MGVSPAIFESASQRTEHYVPGSYSRSSNVTSPSGVSAGNLVIIGESAGGEPDKLLSFSSLADAKDILKSGSLLKGVGYAFNGSPDYTPQRVFAMRVNKGTRSVINLKANGTDLLKVYAWDWGSHTNQVKLWIQNGTVSGSKKLKIGYKDELSTIDNIILPSFSLIYIGDGENPSVTITSTGISCKATIDGEDADVFSTTWENCNTLAELVTMLNDSDVYAASLIDTNADVQTAELDTCSNVDITEDVTFYSNYQAFINALSSVSYIGEIESLDAATRVIPDNTDTFMYFSGAISGSPSGSVDYVDALEILKAEDIQIIATPSNDSAIHNAIKSHCIEMSNTENRKERTCILGAAIGTSDEDGIASAIGFNSKYVSYVIDSGTAANPITGKIENVSGAIIACMAAGVESAMAVNEPLTFKNFNLLSVGKSRKISNMENLIKKGIMVFNPNPENPTQYVCIRGLTTFQGNNDLISCERSMVREDLYMNRDLRNTFASGIGHPNDVSTDSIIQTLKDRASEWATNGYVVPQGTNNVWNIRVRISGDKVYLTYSRYLTAPRNFVFITATNHVYESTVEV